MNNITDLIATLRRPGTSLRVTHVRVSDADLLPTPEQGQVRRVVDVSEDAVWFDNGKMMPFGCAGTYKFDGSPDRFKVEIGPALIAYEIAQGAA